MTFFPVNGSSIVPIKKKFDWSMIQNVVFLFLVSFTQLFIVFWQFFFYYFIFTRRELHWSSVFTSSIYSIKNWKLFFAFKRGEKIEIKKQQLWEERLVLKENLIFFCFWCLFLLGKVFFFLWIQLFFVILNGA